MPISRAPKQIPNNKPGRMIYCGLLHGQLIVRVCWSAAVGRPLLGAVGAAARLTLASFILPDQKITTIRFLSVKIYSSPGKKKRGDQSVFPYWAPPPRVLFCAIVGKGRSSKQRRFNCGSSRLPARPDLPSAVGVCQTCLPAGTLCVAVMCQPRAARILCGERQKKMTHVG